jgi:hypothetical protein
VSKTVGKFRKQKDYQNDDYYEKGYEKAKKRSKNERNELKKMKYYQNDDDFNIDNLVRR